MSKTEESCSPFTITKEQKQKTSLSRPKKSKLSFGQNKHRREGGGQAMRLAEELNYLTSGAVQFDFLVVFTPENDLLLFPWARQRKRINPISGS